MRRAGLEPTGAVLLITGDPPDPKFGVSSSSTIAATNASHPVVINWREAFVFWCYMNYAVLDADKFSVTVRNDSGYCSEMILK